MKRNCYLIFVLFIGAVLLLTACKLPPVKYTGGGTLDSVECGEKANVGFVYNGCKEPATLNFIYQDKADGVKMKGGEILEEIDANTLKVTYTSMSKNEPGEGKAIVTFIDWGEGDGPHGSVYINVIKGPFKGYENWSFIDGNVQKHECNDNSDD